MSTRAPIKQTKWRKPELVCLGDLQDVAGAPAPIMQLNPGNNLVNGKS